MNGLIRVHGIIVECASLRQCQCCGGCGCGWSATEEGVRCKTDAERVGCCRGIGVVASVGPAAYSASLQERQEE